MNNAVAVMRVSSDKQGFEGDSIEHQKDQIDQYAAARNIAIKKYFIFIDSASKEQQPVQEAIDYCKNPKNDVQLFIIKSIDRFTRGGSFLYEHMKSELTKHKVRLVDLYGIINGQEVNTLEHLGIRYSWSVFSPSKKSELLEAERGKDELRDIMSRMIGSEIRYTRLGYRVRAAPLGYQNQRIESEHGKRFILAPHPIESIWVKRMFELKVQGMYSDHEIVKQINLMGFKTKRFYFRDPKDNTKITGIRGEKELTINNFDRLITNPIYAGITCEKWTDNKPIKCHFEGLVSIDTFNKANTGKVMIFEEDGQLEILYGKKLRKRLVNTQSSLKYPYKRIVLCPKCRKPFFGSASRGSSGKYYAAYHCAKRRGHYYRVQVKILHETVLNYLQDIRIKPDSVNSIQTQLSDENKIKTKNTVFQGKAIKDRISQITNEIGLIVDKIKFLHSEIALHSLEAEIEKLTKEKDELLDQEVKLVTEKIKNETETNKMTQIERSKLPEFVIQGHDATNKTHLFNLLFVELPTYEELVNRTALLKSDFELVQKVV